MSDYYVEPTEEDYQKGRQAWGDAIGSAAGVRAVVDYAVGASADRELEACCAWLRERNWGTSADLLEKARRPNLKTRALVALDEAVLHGESFASSQATKIIRQALENIGE